MTSIRTALEQETPYAREQRIAHHEAGHATVSLILERSYIRSAALLSDRENEPASMGEVRFIYFALSDICDLEGLALARAAGARAGIIGELACCNYYHENGSSYDMQCLSQAIGLIAIESHRRATGVIRDVVAEDAVKTHVPPLVEQGEQLATEIIRRENSLFRAIAAELLRKRHLTRDELLELHRQLATVP